MDFVSPTGYFAGNEYDLLGRRAVTAVCGRLPRQTWRPFNRVGRNVGSCSLLGSARSVTDDHILYRTEAGPLARSSLEPNADPADWMYMRLVDCYQFNFIPMKGDSRYNLIVSVSSFFCSL